VKALSKSFRLFHLIPIRAEKASRRWCRTSGSSALRGGGFTEGVEEVEDDALAAVARRRTRPAVPMIEGEEDEVRPASDVRRGVALRAKEERDEEEARSRREVLDVRFISCGIELINQSKILRQKKSQGNQNATKKYKSRQ
jgi:hypothetical protein